jgi:hypothetical protein
MTIDLVIEMGMYTLVIVGETPPGINLNHSDFAPYRRFYKAWWLYKHKQLNYSSNESEHVFLPKKD